EHTVGRGRVLFIGTDTLWKWQTLAAVKDAKVTPYTHFWQQALRALAPPRPHSGDVNLWLQPDRSRYEAGQRVILRAEVEADRPLPQPKVQAIVVLPDDNRVPLAFAADPTEPQVFRAEFETSQPGQHRIAASVNSDGKTAAEASIPIDVEEARGEMSATRVD